MPTKKYKSSLERSVAQKLRRISANNFKYEILKLPYVLEKNYTPDFVHIRNGTILEVKGYLDYEDQVKMKAVRKAHPALRIIFVFQKPHQRLPRQKITHAQWAEKHGFEWCTLETLKDYV